MTDQEYWDCKEVFYKTLLDYVKAFNERMAERFKRDTVSKYAIVAAARAEYIYGYSQHLDLNDLKVSELNSDFWQKYRYQHLYGWDQRDAYKRLKAFVLFLENEGHCPKGTAAKVKVW